MVEAVVSGLNEYQLCQGLKGGDVFLVRKGQ